MAPTILGIGNPLLDISATVGQDVLDKWGVTLNNAILADAKHVPLYQELVEAHQVEYIAGGATQNSIRVAQWMTQQPGTTAYLGCVGKDAFGAQLRKSAEADGVSVHYLEDEAQPTGTCAVLIKDKERSLIANLGAANHYKPEHLDVAEIKEIWTSAQIYYSSGFFLTVSPPSLLKIAEHSIENKKTLAINLAAPFISQFFTSPLNDAIHVADIVFGNESEAEAYGKVHNFEDCSTAAVALKIAALPKKDESRPRMVVITQGSEPTIVACEGKIQTFAVPPINKDDIVDSNGAGDAFVGGFLSKLSQGLPIDTCVHAGHYAASCILKVSGTALNGKPNFQ